MLSSIPRRLVALAAAAVLITTLAAPAGAAGPVSIQVNGNTLNLNPAPTERAGRVFVPLRGVFENLGASVVYASGVINASGRGHNVSLRIGSQQATVDGQQQNLDVAPFIIGASTYVPLRFVSQALGATVNYDGNNRIVAISTNGNTAVNTAPQNQTITPVPERERRRRGDHACQRAAGPRRERQLPAAADRGDVRGWNRRPEQRAGSRSTGLTSRTTRLDRPTASRTRRAPRCSLASIRSTSTGNDSQRRLVPPRLALHVRHVDGERGQISNVSPGNGATVPNQFTISGHTSPGARVTITIGAATGNSSSIGGLIGAILGGGGNQGNTASYTVNANENGNFSQGVSVNAPSGTRLAIAINATDPNTGASGIPVQEQVSIQ